MKDRLNQFLAAENLSQSQFADLVHVARAAVSHILAGRNKPGYDFIQNMANAFPTLNIDWLITGRGRMYKDSSPYAAVVPEPSSPSIYGTPTAATKPSNEGASLFDTAEEPVTEPVNQTSNTQDAARAVPPAASQSGNVKSIIRISVFYDNGTYQEFC